MLHKVAIVILAIYSSSFAFSQLPELQQQKNTLEREIEATLNDSKGGNLAMYNKLSLARNYYKLDNYTEAERYYLQVITEPMCTPLDYKALAICLKHNGKMSLADEFYQAYAENAPSTTFNKMWSIESSQQKGITRSVETKLTQYDFMYGSVNPDGSASLNIDHGTVTGNLSCESFINLEAVQFPVPLFDHLGGFTQAEKEASYYYSYLKPDNRFGIFFIQNKKGKWSKPKVLELGEIDADYCFPFFVNGTLYFSSNKSGGHGQFDLYHATVQGKKVLTVQNLGKQVNTDKNEILPSVFDGSFSFATNGLPGQGGYDVYYTDWTFQRVTAVEAPFNSNANEFLLIQKDNEKASICRQSGDKLNLVRVSYYVDYLKTLHGRVVDEESNTVENARVLLTKSYVDQGVFQSSVSDGSFKVVIPDTVDTWMIECHKDGYEKTSFEVDISTLGDNPLIIVLNLVKPIEPEPVFVMSSKSSNVIPAEPQIDDSTATQPSDNSSFSEVDETGRFYIVLASTKSYESAYAIWNKKQVDYPGLEILKNEEKQIYRVGIYGGSNYKEALGLYKKTRSTVPDAWILRPDML